MMELICERAFSCPSPSKTNLGVNTHWPQRTKTRRSVAGGRPCHVRSSAATRRRVCVH